MKKILCLAILLVFTGALSAQIPHRKGYVGICLGPAFPMGDVDNSAVSGGLQLNIVNFGYLTGEHVGIAATWFGTSFVSKANNDDYIGLGGMLFGPLLSTSSASSEFDFDLKPMVGFGTGSARVNGYSTSSSMSFVFGLGGAVRWNCGNRISLSVGADYYHSKPDDVDLSSLAILFGINYRFK